MTATAAAVIIATAAAGGTPTRTGSGLAQARETAYIVTRVENALASEHGVYHGVTMSTGGQPSVTWGYGRRSRFEEFTGKACGHAAYPSGDCTHAGGSERYLAQGTALSQGEAHRGLRDLFRPAVQPLQVSVHPTVQRLREGGDGDGRPGAGQWRLAGLVKATLACGGARVTGHARINGVQTTKITGKPVTVRLSGDTGRWCTRSTRGSGGPCT